MGIPHSGHSARELPTETGHGSSTWVFPDEKRTKTGHAPVHPEGMGGTVDGLSVPALISAQQFGEDENGEEWEWGSHCANKTDYRSNFKPSCADQKACLTPLAEILRYHGPILEMRFGSK
jgi:hypothetical protein